MSQSVPTIQEKATSDSCRNGRWCLWVHSQEWGPFCLSNPLLVASFANIFFHFIDRHIISLMVFFAVQKLLSFIRSHLFTFVFISITLEGGSKRLLL